MSDKAYVSVDNSNVWIEGKKVAGRLRNPSIPLNGRYRIEYGKLLQHVLDGRDLAAVPKLYGSKPPPNDSVWYHHRCQRALDIGADAVCHHRQDHPERGHHDHQQHRPDCALAPSTMASRSCASGRPRRRLMSEM